MQLSKLKSNTGTIALRTDCLHLAWKLLEVLGIQIHALR